MIPFLITSCGGGVTVKATDRSKINFKSENVSCKWDDLSESSILKCTANGVRTYLNGARENYSDERFCSRTEYGKEANPKDWWANPNPNSFVCRTARKFGKY